ncbi:MAG: hypothetical protein HYT79_04855 [Elusimicrobia bacterium]|nr:hypothetical protein [Elusimicrobiota bacterium]
MLVAAIMTMAVFFLVVWVRTQVIRSGYRLTELKEAFRKADLDLAETEIRLTKLKARPSAAKKARDQGYRLPGEYAPEKIKYLR